MSEPNWDVPAGTTEYENMRQLIAFQQHVEPRGTVHAAMLSELGKLEQRGEPCPGWVELEDRARSRLVAPTSTPVPIR